MVLKTLNLWFFITFAAMLLQIHPENPQARLVSQVVECLKKGGVIIYPTDTVYGLGCDIMNKRAVERVCQIKGIRPDNARLSCLCDDISTIARFSAQIHTDIFKVMKRALPGPYTFILKASKEVPKHFHDRRKTIGVRWVDQPIVNAVLAGLGNPIVSTSLYSEEVAGEFLCDPHEIYEQFKNKVDMVIDGGWGQDLPSTILDCSEGDNEINIIREGLGSLDIL